MEPVVHIGDGVAVVELGDCLVVLWEHPAIQSRWEWQRAHMDAMAAKCPDGFLMLNIIASTASPPSGPLRRQMQTYFRTIVPRLRKLVVVALGDSLWLSVVRTIIRALALLSGQSDRQVVLATTTEGIAVLRELGATPTVPELNRAVELVAGALGVRALR